MQRLIDILIICVVFVTFNDYLNGQAIPRTDLSSRSSGIQRVLDIAKMVNTIAQNSERRGMDGKTVVNRVSHKELASISASVQTITNLNDLIVMARIFKAMLGEDFESKDYDVPVDWAYWTAVAQIAKDPSEKAHDILKEFALGTDAGEALNIQHYQHLQAGVRKQYLAHQHTTAKN